MCLIVTNGINSIYTYNTYVDRDQYQERKEKGNPFTNVFKHLSVLPHNPLDPTAVPVHIHVVSVCP